MPHKAFFLLQQRELKGACAAHVPTQVQKLVEPQAHPHSQQGLTASLMRRFVEVKEIQAHSLDTCNVLFANSGEYFFTASEDSLIKMWCKETLLLRHTFKGHALAVNCIAISHDDAYLASSSNDGTIRIWNCATGVQEKIIYEEKETHFVGFVASQKRIIYTSGNCMLRMMELWPETKTCLELATTAAISQVSIHPFGTHFVAGDCSGHVYIYDLEASKTFVNLFD